MKRQTFYLWAVILLAALSPAAFASPTSDEAVREASFPSSPAVGQTAYGYAFYNDVGGGLDKRTYHGWCRPLAEGDTTYWSDRNLDGKVEPDERSTMHWWAWYNAELELRYCPPTVGRSGDRLRSGAKEMLDLRAKSWKLTQSLPLGDGAFIGGDPFCFLAVAYGPFLITVTVHAYLSPFTDINGVEPTRFPSAYLDGPALLEKGKAWRAGRRNEAIRIANEVMEKLHPCLARLQAGVQAPPAPTASKPSETPVAGEADLVIHPYDIHLTPQPHFAGFPREKAADRQNVRVLVANMGKAPAKDVSLQLYTSSKGAPPTPVGGPIAVGTLDPSRNKTVDAVWDLQGCNVEATALLVKAYTQSGHDANPVDNLASITCHIWYASNGKRAFSAYDDAYRFVNFGWNDREFEEMLEGVLATVVNALDTGSDERNALGRLVFPVVYGRLKTYLQESMRLGSGGHCYGMSSTAGLYFEDPARKPVAIPVPAMTLAQASTNINIYQRAQMLPVLQAIARDRNYQARDDTPRVCYNAIRNALSASRLAPVLEFFGATGQGTDLNYLGHAVLAYKLVHVEGRDPVVYVYDPNFPVSALPAGAPLPYITLRVDKGTWSNPSYMGYSWADATQISAHRVFREMPIDAVNALIPSMKRLGYAMADTLYRTKKMMTMVRCPVDAVVTDSKGRRTGIIGGKAINDMPKGRLVADGEVKIFVLPADETYTISLTGTGTGTMALDVMRADTPEQARVVSFEQVPVTQGGTFTGRLQPHATTISGPQGAVAPALDTTVAIPASNK